jgi:hypothetical protein
MDCSLDEYVERVFSLGFSREEAQRVALEVMKLHEDAWPIIFVESDEATVANIRVLMPAEPPPKKCPMRKHVLPVLCAAALCGNWRMALLGGAIAAAVKAIRRGTCSPPKPPGRSPSDAS